MLLEAGIRPLVVYRSRKAHSQEAVGPLPAPVMPLSTGVSPLQIPAGAASLVEVSVSDVVPSPSVCGSSMEGLLLRGRVTRFLFPTPISLIMQSQLGCPFLTVDGG